MSAAEIFEPSTKIEAKVSFFSSHLNDMEKMAKKLSPVAIKNLTEEQVYNLTEEMAIMCDQLEELIFLLDPNFWLRLGRLLYVINEVINQYEQKHTSSRQAPNENEVDCTVVLKLASSVVSEILDLISDQLTIFTHLYTAA